ncbi:hypothetical protein, partial [Escherichia coli]|uniref:hypothetical protein n=1 Tax=Escherichia coli TaxID=562 RepID=UPI0032AEB2E8
PQNDVTLKMPAFEWVHVQLHQQKGMISLSPPTICNSANLIPNNLLHVDLSTFLRLHQVIIGVINYGNWRQCTERSPHNFPKA